MHVRGQYLNWDSKNILNKVLHLLNEINFDIGAKPFNFLPSYPVDTRRKLNVHKTFRRRPGRLLNVLYTFNIRHMSMG